jgi:hypothetical protein
MQMFTSSLAGVGTVTWTLSDYAPGVLQVSGTRWAINSKDCPDEVRDLAP